MSRLVAHCAKCGNVIVRFSEAHWINPEQSKHAEDELYIHCKCNGCKKNRWGDYGCSHKADRVRARRGVK